MFFITWFNQQHFFASTCGSERSDAQEIVDPYAECKRHWEMRWWRFVAKHPEILGKCHNVMIETKQTGPEAGASIF